MATIDFTRPEYLKYGNDRQKSVYDTLTRYRILECLRNYEPVVVGTLPIGIDIVGSDIDIICRYLKGGHQEFLDLISEEFSGFPGFKITVQEPGANTATVVNFKAAGWEVEIYACEIPVLEQNAYRHMIIEHSLLLERGENFRQRIIARKNQGLKTEPAFAIELGIKGDPYIGLLDYGKHRGWY